MNESRAFASSAFWVEIELLAGSPMQLFRFVSISLRKLGGVTTPVGEQFVGLTPRKSSGQWHLRSDSLSFSPEREIAPQNSLTSTNTNYMYGQNVRRLFRLAFLSTFLVRANFTEQ